MIKWIYKYGLVVLLLNTILYSIPETMHTIAPSIFYVLMFLTILFLLINPHHLKEVLFHRSFLFILLINCLNLVYFLFFDDIKNQKSLEYLLARFGQYSLISFSVYYNFNYFKTDFQDLLIRIIVFVVIFSLIFNPFIFDDRYSGILWNPNMLASISVIAFSYLLIKNSSKSNMDYFLLILLFIIAISTGSRLVIIGIVLSFIFKFGFSLRNFMYSIFALFLVLFVVSTDLNTSINRISSQSIFNDRTLQFQLALESINDKLIKGHGLSNYSGIPEIVLGEEYDGIIVPAHNGYLSLFIQYGIIFGTFVLFIILWKSFEVFNFFKLYEGHIKFYLFLVIYTLISANVESLITGINEFHTILFWLSLAYLSHSKFLEDYAD